MISKRLSPLRINIYGEHSNEFICHRTALNEHGYHLEAHSNIEQLLAKSDSPEISIISSAISSEILGHLDNPEIAEHSSPFLVYDFAEQCDFGEGYTFAHKAVGHFIDKPTPQNICLKVELGLLLHQERRAISKRFLDLNQKFETNRDIGIATGIIVVLGELTVQQAYEFLRRIARNQRCRVSDVAKTLVNNQESEQKLRDLPSIQNWLEDNISTHLNRD